MTSLPPPPKPQAARSSDSGMAGANAIPIADALALLPTFGDLPAQRKNDVLASLELHECWVPFFRALKKALQDSKTRQLHDYVRLAKAQGLFLEDIGAAADTCAQAIKDLDCHFEVMRDQVLPHIIESEDFLAEAQIWEKCLEYLKDKSDKIAVLERLSLLYDKKIHSENQLAKSYEKLLAIAPQNIKALRYFKLVFTQTSDWKDVVTVLKKLLTAVKHPQEVFRYAQELAGVYLYQLDMPEDAIKTLETYCNNSPLDTSTIHFDAFQRLGDSNGCIKVLRGCLLNVNDDFSRAVLHFRIAGIREQNHQLDDALENYQTAARLWPEFLEPLEGAISIAIQKRNWALTMSKLNDLKSRIRDPELGSQLVQAIRRLEDGLAHGSTHGSK